MMLTLLEYFSAVVLLVRAASAGLMMSTAYPITLNLNKETPFP